MTLNPSERPCARQAACLERPARQRWPWSAATEPRDATPESREARRRYADLAHCLVSSALRTVRVAYVNCVTSHNVSRWPLRDLGPVDESQRPARTSSCAGFTQSLPGTARFKALLAAAGLPVQITLLGPALHPLPNALRIRSANRARLDRRAADRTMRSCSWRPFRLWCRPREGVRPMRGTPRSSPPERSGTWSGLRHGNA